MRRLLALLAIVIGVPACAEDSIRIEFVPGECIGCSGEKSEVSIARTTAPGPIQTKLDELFNGIRRSLGPVVDSKGCELVPAIHADVVKIEIVLASQRYLLRSGYEAGAIPQYVNESAHDARCRELITYVLEQSLKYTATRFPAGHRK